MQIRQAGTEDSASVARIQVDSYRTAYADILPAAYLSRFSYSEQEQDWRDLLSFALHDIVYIAEMDSGEIVGYAMGRPDRNTIAPYDGELVALHVRGSHQRKGIGQRLIATIAEHLRQQGCTSLFLWVLAENPARSFYERLGGQLIGERETDLGGGDVRAVEVAYGWPNIGSLCAPSIRARSASEEG